MNFNNSLKANFLEQNYEQFVSSMWQLTRKERKSIVDSYISEYSLSTYLSIACQEQDYEMIKFLVIDCQADTNILCKFKLRNEKICTPLMYSCAKNLTQIVKLLIEYGHSDVNQTDSSGESCLFYAVRESDDCQDLVEYLIDNKVDLNRLNNRGHNVLHYSLNHDTNNIMSLLLDRNCPIVNTVSLDAHLLLCALNGDVVKYNMLYCQKDVPKELKIIGNEILGAVLCENQELVEYSIFYWQISLQERGNIEKTNLRQMNGFLSEFSNETDLIRIGKDTIDFCLQSLWIRERILLKFKTPSKLSSMNVYRSLHTNNAELNTEFLNPHTYLAMNQSRLETLWLYSLGIQLKFSHPLDDQLMSNLVDYVMYLTYVNTHLRSTFQAVNAFKLAKICLFLISRLYRSARLLAGVRFDDLFELNDPELAKIEIDHDCCFQGDEFIFNFIAKVFILTLRMLTIDENYSQLKGESRHELKMLTKRFIYIDRRFNKGTSLLEVSLKSHPITWFDDYERNFEVNSPVTLESVSYLLECGLDANSNQINSNPGRNKCFNKSLFSLDDDKLCQRLVQVFLKHGAHYDYSNDSMLTPEEEFKLKYNRSIPVDVINPVKHTSLKCLSTKVIRRHGLEYHSLLPRELVEFVELH